MDMLEWPLGSCEQKIGHQGPNDARLDLLVQNNNIPSATSVQSSRTTRVANSAGATTRLHLHRGTTLTLHQKDYN